MDYSQISSLALRSRTSLEAALCNCLCPPFMYEAIDHITKRKIQLPSFPPTVFPYWMEKQEPIQIPVSCCFYMDFCKGSYKDVCCFMEDAIVRSQPDDHFLPPMESCENLREKLKYSLLKRARTIVSMSSQLRVHFSPYSDMYLSFHILQDEQERNRVIQSLLPCFICTIPFELGKGFLSQFLLDWIDRDSFSIVLDYLTVVNEQEEKKLVLGECWLYSRCKP